MGNVCLLNPQQRAIHYKNVIYFPMKEALKLFMISQLNGYHDQIFISSLKNSIDNMLPRYLFTDGIIEDIDRLKIGWKKSVFMTESKIKNFDENLEYDLTESELILEDQNIEAASKQFRMNNHTNSTQSFKEIVSHNQSLVMQIKILYGKQIDQSIYNNSLRSFLKWVEIFYEHSYGGFLKPVYQAFCNTLYHIPKQQLPTVVDQTVVFIQYMITIYTTIYNLKMLNSKEDGRFFKNQNVHNIIMSYLFKRSKIQLFVRSVIRKNMQSEIYQYKEKLSNHNYNYLKDFHIPAHFLLGFNESQNINYQQKSIFNASNLQKQPQSPILKNNISLPYDKSVKILSELSKTVTPIGKLKVIVKIAKSIMKQIKIYYTSRNQELPQLDPDSLTSIIIYIIIRNKNQNLLEELKIIQNFTTNNCLTCISGYYLNVFLASIQTLSTS